MKLQVLAKFALAAVMLGGVLTACESEYDPTAADANQPVTENQQETADDGTSSDISGDSSGDSSGANNSTVANNNNTATNNGTTNEMGNNSGTNSLPDESQASGDQETGISEEYGISDERDGTPDTGSWDDSTEPENAQTSDMQAGDTGTDENQEESVSGTFDDIQSDVAAKEQQAVEFEFDSAELTGEAKNKLDDFIESMEEVDPQEVELLIKGYTDTQGSEEYNQALARRRADAVKEYLQEQGLRSENLEIEAIGEASSENIAATIQDNRRVVVEVVVSYADELTAN